MRALIGAGSVIGSGFARPRVSEVRRAFAALGNGGLIRAIAVALILPGATVGPLAAQAQVATPATGAQSPAAQRPTYPRIERLLNNDVAVRQIQQDVEAFYRSGRGDGEIPALVFFRYQVQPGDRLFALAARLTISDAAITSLNRLTEPQLPAIGTTILIPNLPGVFVATVPTNAIEQLVADRYAEAVALTHAAGAPGMPVAVWRHDVLERLVFFPGGALSPAERAALVRTPFITPVRNGRLTSRFGMRTNPFSGLPTFHAGVDLAAPTDTLVRAVRAGTVVERDEHPVFGLYVLLQHDQRVQTFYAHLNGSPVAAGDRVSQGTTIGTVGNSGLSTGPHLHFEIRVNGISEDPREFIPEIWP